MKQRKASSTFQAPTHSDIKELQLPVPLMCMAELGLKEGPHSVDCDKLLFISCFPRTGGVPLNSATSSLAHCQEGRSLGFQQVRPYPYPQGWISDRQECSQGPRNRAGLEPS